MGVIDNKSKDLYIDRLKFVAKLLDCKIYVSTLLTRWMYGALCETVVVYIQSGEANIRLEIIYSVDKIMSVSFENNGENCYMKDFIDESDLEDVYMKVAELL